MIYLYKKRNPDFVSGTHPKGNPNFIEILGFTEISFKSVILSIQPVKIIYVDFSTNIM